MDRWEKCVWCGKPSQFEGRDFLCFDCYWDADAAAEDRLEDKDKKGGVWL
mgnify:CR=1 FL=1